MDRNSLRPMYANLTGEERFRLGVQAAVAGDEKEATYLLQSCPRVVGTVRDPAFTTPALASFSLTSAFARGVGPYLGSLALLAELEGVLTGERGRTLLPPPPMVPVALVLDRFAEGAARDLRALVDAFEEVCRERVGLGPDVLLALWAPQVAVALEAAEVWIQGLEADPALRQRFKAGLDQVWTLSLEPGD